MFNWNASANTDDGSCIPYRFGCTDDASTDLFVCKKNDTPAEIS